MIKKNVLYYVQGIDNSIGKGNERGKRKKRTVQQKKSWYESSSAQKEINNNTGPKRQPSLHHPSSPRSIQLFTPPPTSSLSSHLLGPGYWIPPAKTLWYDTRLGQNTCPLLHLVLKTAAATVAVTIAVPVAGAVVITSSGVAKVRGRSLGCL